jgi:PAS domain S-box-containing protein
MTSGDDTKAPIHILAVDDNPAALYATSRVLRSAGFEVSNAMTGNAALAAARSADLVVLDVNLPDMDGFEVCRRLRAAPETARVPVLHLSATFTQAGDFDIGLHVGADGYLTRPVEPAVLIATVRTLLFARRADSLRLGLDARLRTMFELAPSGMAILDSRLNYENVNAAFCAIAGCAADEMIGKALAETPGRGWREVAKQLSQRNRWHGELPITRPDGGVCHLDWRVAREELSAALFVTATDITERVRHEVEREQLLASERAARAEAERGNRLKEEFLATLSHELRNPLNAILGWAKVLTLTEGLPPKAATAVEAIHRNGKLQATMIGDLLDFAAITFGKLRLVPETVDPYVAVRAAVEIMHATAAASGVELRCSYGAAKLTVHADPDRLQQIVWNLVSNAIKFSSSGGTVEIVATQEEQCFMLAVKDSGRGISPEFLPKVFDRFSQADATSTRRHGGLGIGMAIVKQLAQLQGGTVQAFSGGVGKGATFVLRLPLSQDTMQPQPSESSLLRALDLSGSAIIVVEDDDDARGLIRRVLSDVGADVFEARDAKTAADLVAANTVSLLISDIGMPEMDGYQLLRDLRERGYDANALPAIALTAFARMEDRERALAAGFQDHLVKPIEGQVLIARVARLLRRAPRG